MVGALWRSFGILAVPGVWRTVALAAMVAIVLIAILLGAGLWLLGEAGPGTGWTGYGWLDQSLDIVFGAAGVFLLLALFPTAYTLVMAQFLDRVADLAERRLRPGLPAARPVSAGEALRLAVRFLWFSLAVNLACLPFYLTPGINAVVFFVANGYVLGREYFDLLAQRRLDPARARELWRRRRLDWWLVGLVILGLTLVPPFSLVAPIIGTALMADRLLACLGTGAGPTAGRAGH